MQNGLAFIYIYIYIHTYISISVLKGSPFSTVTEEKLTYGSMKPSEKTKTNEEYLLTAE